MQLLLKRDIYCDIIDDEIPQNPDKTWKERDAEAAILIGLAAEDSEVLRIASSNNAKEAWNILKAYHEKLSLSNKVKLMRTICEL